MKRYILFLVLLSSIFQTNAQLLWKISGNGLKKPSYLFGTHHLAPLSILDSIPAFNDAFSSCPIVYGEVVIGDKETIKKDTKKNYESMIAPPDSTLDLLLSEHLYKKLDSITQKNMNLTADQIKKLKPAAIYIQLIMIKSLKYFKDFNLNEQLDEVIQRRALSANKQIRSFETSQQQSNILYDTPVKKQLETLKAIIELYDECDQYIKRTKEAYMTQDINTLINLLNNETFGLNDNNPKNSSDERNLNWNEQLKEILPKDEPIFIAVGAGHLPGKNGLIELLRKQGYTVEPA
ncbi:MAG: TraB/GumN family protein [Bacteroidales bacterium]